MEVKEKRNVQDHLWTDSLVKLGQEFNYTVSESGETITQQQQERSNHLQLLFSFPIPMRLSALSYRVV
jgi:hypothetical protein